MVEFFLLTPCAPPAPSPGYDLQGERNAPAPAPSTTRPYATPAPYPPPPAVTIAPAPYPAPRPTGTHAPYPIPVPTPPPVPQGGYYPPPKTTDTIGLAAGGAKDIVNFRENIRNNYLPLPTDITYEGLFYDYYFDTGATAPTNKLFSPSYSYAGTRDPFSRQIEYYLSVGLNSGLRQEDFARKKLNLAIVLDIS